MSCLRNHLFFIELPMCACAPSILIYGLDATLLKTRRWLLEASGYQAVTATRLAQFDCIPQQPPIKLLILCHSLDEESCAEALQLAEARWPGIKHLALATNMLKPKPNSSAEVMLSLGGPITLIANVNTLVGQPAATLQ